MSIVSQNFMPTMSAGTLRRRRGTFVVVMPGTLLRQRVDDPSVELRFPVHVRRGGEAGHPDERDRLTARDVVADRHERQRGVVVAALEAASVDDAHPEA